MTELDLADLDGRVPLEAIYDAVEAALDAAGDPLLGVHVVERVTVEDLDAMALCG